jgi:hypothetical protein
MKVIAQTGRYGMATVEYAGLVYYSYLKRGGGFIRDTGKSGLTAVRYTGKSGLTAVRETGKYGWAAVSYAGWGSLWYLRRGGAGVKKHTLKVVGPVSRVTVAPFHRLMGKKIPAAAMVRYDQRLDEMVGRIEKMDQRLAAIEKHGVRLAADGATKEEKPLGQDQRMLLRTIMEDTKALREEE